jgi:hypothetical protein
MAMAALCGSPALTAGTVYSDYLAFLADGGDLHLEDFHEAVLVGTTSSGGVELLPFHGFRARADLAALKVLDVPDQGNHGTSVLDSHYLAADTDSLGLHAVVTLEFEPPVDRVAFWAVDLDMFPLGITVEGRSYSLPATGNGGRAFFGYLGDGPFDQVVLEPLGADSHYSLDDIRFNPPPAPEPVGSVPLPGRGEPPLSITGLPGGQLHLSWAPSCAAGDDDYEIYRGTLGDPSSHVPLTCTTGGLTSVTLDPGPGSSYFLAVPRNETREGSYGRGSDDLPRFRPVAACLLQETVHCP